MEMEIETKRENYNPLDNIDYGFINFLLVEGFNQNIFLDKEFEFLYKLSAKDKLLEDNYEKELIQIIVKYCILETLDYKLVKKWIREYVQMFYKEYIVSEKIFIKEEVKEQIVKLLLECNKSQKSKCDKIRFINSFVPILKNLWI